MPPSQNPKPRHVRPEVIARLRQRIKKFTEKDGIYQLLLAARALSEKQKINPVNMASRNARASVFAKKYKIALQIAMRREGITNRAFYEEMNAHLFDLARTPDSPKLSHYQKAILDAMGKTMMKYGIDYDTFTIAMKSAIQSLHAE